MADEELKLLQGTLDVLVMKALAGGPQHGYAVAEWIRETSEDALLVEDGALYNALHRMEKRRLLESSWGLSKNNRRAKYYRLTTKGRRHLERQTKTWNTYAAAVFKVLESEGGNR